MKVSIVVPVLNEKPILEIALARLEYAVQQVKLCGNSEWEVIVADSGSTDGSVEIAAGLARQPGWRHLALKIPAPSVGKTVSAAVVETMGEIILILPCDTSVDAGALDSLVRAITEGKRCGGFEKTYEPSTCLLAWYARAQNILRSRWLRHLVWTNGIFFSVGDEARGSLIPTSGFLEDVIFSDRLRRQPGWSLLRAQILVSARRYYPDRVVKRIFVNFLIMVLYRLRLAGPDYLRKLYTSLK